MTLPTESGEAVLRAWVVLTSARSVPDWPAAFDRLVLQRWQALVLVCVHWCEALASNLLPAAAAASQS